MIYKIRLSITQKLIGFIIISTLIPLILIGFVSYQVSRSTLLQTTSDYNRQLVSDQKAYLDVYLQGIKSLIVNISGVEEITNVINNQQAPADVYTDLATQARVGYILNNYSSLKGLVSIDLFAASGVHYHVGETLNANSARLDVQQEIAKTALSTGSDTLWLGIMDNVNAESKYPKVISVARSFTQSTSPTPSMNHPALLIVNYDVQEFYSHFSQIQSGQGAYMMVIDSQNRILYHPRKDLLASKVNSPFMEQIARYNGSLETDVDGIPMFVSYATSDLSGWKVVSFIPVSVLTRQALPIGLSTLMVIFVCLIGVALLNYWYNANLVMPIRKITDAFKQEQQGPLNQASRLVEKGQDELSELFRWYNTFLDSRAAQEEAENALRRRERYATLLNGITLAALETTDLQTMLATIAQAFGESLNANSCMLYIHDSSMKGEPFVSSIWMQEEIPDETFQPVFAEIAECVLEGGKECILNDLSSFSQVPLGPSAALIRTVIALPLISAKDKFGAALIAYYSDHAIDSEEIEFSRQAAAQISLAVAKVHLLEESQHRAHIFEILYGSASEFSNLDQFDALLVRVAEQASSLLKVPFGFVFLYDKAAQTLELKAIHGIPHAQSLRVTTDGQALGLDFHAPQPVLVNDYQSLPAGNKIFGACPLSSLAMAPMIWTGELIGVLGVASGPEDQHRFDENDLRTLSLLSGLGTNALNSTRMYTEIRRFNEELEQGIKERTHQLEITNRELEAEITERILAEAALKEERASLSERIEERTKELSAANSQLGRAVRAKDEFLANMSHELRTPLNAILGLSEALQDQVYGSLTETQAKSLRTIEESGRHLLSLINDILDLSKIEAGKLELQTTWVNVQDICRGSLQFVKQMALKKEVSIELSVDPSIDMIWADDRRLKQILVNLLTNAVKFTPEGGKVGLIISRDDNQDSVHFCVWDRGIGISPADQQRLFKPFVQIDSGLARHHEGTGLGLALVSRLAEMHGGSVTLESESGKGSRFTISLPWKESFLKTEDVQPDIPVQKPEKACTALLVENSEAARETIQSYAKDMQIQLITTPKGNAALDLALTHQPDMIFLDLLLPDISGWEVLAQLKSNPRTRNIPVVITAAIDERPRASMAGATDYLIKPISRQDFLRGLTRATRIKTTGLLSFPTLTPMLDQSGSLILLAEDNDMNIETIGDYLKIKGFQVAVAHNGIEACELAAAQLPALILMDIQMPGMDGLEATQNIRANSKIAHIPIIALTALAMPGDRERCLAAGANDYLSKPISLKKLVRIIQFYLSSKENRPSEGQDEL